MTGDLKTKSEAYWRSKLTPEQYRVVRQRATEAPWTGAYVDHHSKGEYKCVACGQTLFTSDAKFESGSGWPSFYDVAQQGTVEFREDHSFGMDRVEAVCAHCGGHLGHVFDDGPAEKTGKRYCINSCALKFAPARKAEAE